MSIVDDAVEDGVSEGGFTDQVVSGSTGIR
jgi:hypothetical protein